MILRLERGRELGPPTDRGLRWWMIARVVLVIWRPQRWAFGVVFSRRVVDLSIGPLTLSVGRQRMVWKERTATTNSSHLGSYSWTGTMRTRPW